MADFKFSDGIKTFFLAGVGAVTLTAEKSQAIIADLVKKGELTVEQGKELNKDLQRGFKESMEQKGVNIDEISQKISKMSTEEIAKIKEQIAAAEKIVSERLNKAEKEAEEAVADVEAAAEYISENQFETAFSAFDVNNDQLKNIRALLDQKKIRVRQSVTTVSTALTANDDELDDDDSMYDDIL